MIMPGPADVILEVLEMYKERGREFDTVCCIYSTAPFVTPERLREAYGKMNSEIDSVFTCVAYSYPIQRSLHIVDGRIGMVYPEYMNARSQDLEPIYHDAGQFYFSRTAPFLWRAGLFGGRTQPDWYFPNSEVQDLDTLTDWTLAEMKYELLHDDVMQKIYFRADASATIGYGHFIRTLALADMR